MRTILVTMAAMLTAAPAAAAAQAPGDTGRMVALELRENGRVLAASNVRVELGRPAAIRASNGYTMRVRVDAAAGGAGYTVRPALHQSGPDGWTRLATQPISVARGVPARATVARPGAAPLELAVAVD